MNFASSNSNRTKLMMNYYLLVILLATAVHAQRSVWVVFDFTPAKAIPDPQTGELLPSMHAAVHVDGAGNDGQLRMTMVEPSREAGLAVDILDYTAAKNGQLMIGPQAAGEGRTRQTVYVGETSRTNAEIADINNAGRGLALDTFLEPPFESEYYQGEADCMVFCQKMMEKLGVPANAFVDDMVKKNSQRIEALMAANREFKPAFRIDVSLRLRTALPGDEKINDVKEYNIRDDPKNPQLMQRPLQQDISATRYDDAGDPFADSKPIALPSQEDMLDFDNERVQASPWDTPLCERSLEARCDSAPRSKVVGSEVTFGRMRGVASTVTIIAPDVANALGAAAAAAQAVLVILDFVDKQWQHAALGAVTLASLPTLALGPVGVAIQVAVFILFDFLPGLFEHHATMPGAHNITEIIRYQMWADASKTGNEKCQKGNPQCQVVYGPGVISLIFGWELFDAVAFMIQYNEGYAMTIEDMAAAFQFNGTANAAAVVDCHNGAHHPGLHGGINGDDPRFCNHAKFSLDRNLIMLPNINKTAGEIYGRMIPNPGGDCKISDPSANPTSFPAYNITVTGLPVSIACNITAAINLGGTAVAVGAIAPPAGFDQGSSDANANTTTNSTNVQSPGQASTNGLPGAYQAPPPPSDFLPVFNATNSICMTGSSGSSCFPNGTYDAQDGAFGFATTGVTSMTLPPNSFLRINTTTFQFHAENKYSSNTYTTNRSDKAFVDDIQTFNTTSLKKTGRIDVIVPGTPPPGACFFTQADYHGDVFCLGPGGGNFTAAGSGKAESVMLYGNAIAYLFPIAYANEGEIKLTASIPDLKTEPYGTNGNFAGQVVAAWITAGS